MERDEISVRGPAAGIIKIGIGRDRSTFATGQIDDEDIHLTCTLYLGIIGIEHHMTPIRGPSRVAMIDAIRLDQFRFFARYQGIELEDVFFLTTVGLEDKDPVFRVPLGLDIHCWIIGQLSGIEYRHVDRGTLHLGSVL